MNNGTDSVVTELSSAGDHMNLVVSAGDERAITSTKPVMVTSFSSQESGDPSMYVCDAALLLVVPTEQMLRRYSLTQEIQATAHAWGVVEDGEEGGLVQTGGSLTWTWAAASIDGTYKTGWAPLNDPFMRISHNTKPFSLYQEGSGEEGSSAVPLGMKLCPIAVTPTLGDGYDNDCDGRIDEESGDASDDDGDGISGEDRAPMVAPPPEVTEETTATESATEAENTTNPDNNNNNNNNDGNNGENSTETMIMTTSEEMATTPPTTDGKDDKEWYSNKTIIVLGGCVVGVFVIIVLYIICKMIFPEKDKKVNFTRGPKVTMVDDGKGKKEAVEVLDYEPMDLPDYAPERRQNTGRERTNDMPAVYS